MSTTILRNRATVARAATVTRTAGSTTATTTPSTSGGASESSTDTLTGRKPQLVDQGLNTHCMDYKGQTYYTMS